MPSTTIDRLDGLSSSTAVKGPVRVATTANITLSGTQTIDGTAVVADDRVLVKNQTTASENGIWVVDTGAWRRAKDFSGNRDVKKGTLVNVTDGTENVGEWWVTAENPITIGTTSLTFQKIIDGLIDEVFTADLDDTVSLSLREVLERVYTPAMWGVVNDAALTTDQLTKMQAMYDALPAGATVDFGSFQIYCAGSPTVSKDIKQIGVGAKIRCAGGYFTAQGTLTERTYSAGVSAKWDRTFEVNSATGISANDLLILHKNTDRSFGPHQAYHQDGEFVEVESIASTTLTLKERLKTSYTATTDHKVFEVAPVRFESDGITYENANDASYGLRLVCCRDVAFRGHVRGGTSAALSMHQCFNVDLLGGSTFIQDDGASGEDYGVIVSNSQNVRGHPNCYAFGARHGVAMGGTAGNGTVPVRNAVFTGWRIAGTTAALHSADIHANAADSGYVDCEVDGSIWLGGRDTFARNCTVIGWHAGAQRPLQLGDVIGGVIDFSGCRVRFASTSAATSVIGVATSASFGIGTQNYHIKADDLDIECTATLTHIASVFHNMTGTVEWSWSADRMRLRGDTSGLTNIAILTVSNTLSHGSAPVCASFVSLRAPICENALTLAQLTPTTSGTWTTCVLYLPVVKGSNANGSYTRHEDGSMTCRHLFTVTEAITTAYGSGGFRGSSNSWTFPAVYTAAPIVNATAGLGSANSAVKTSVATTTTTYPFFILTHDSSASAAREVDLMAVGRQFN